MKCPKGHAICKQQYIKRLPCGSWYCFGITKRRWPKGALCDVVCFCMSTAFSNGERQLELTPDEAMILSNGLNICAEKWLQKFKAYQEWREDREW